MIDFLDFHLAGYHWPAFNLADSAIFVGAAVMLADGLRPELPSVLAAADKPKAPKAKAKSVIQIFLWGGMSHNDTWDPKPEAGREYMGEFSEVIPTNVDMVRADHPDLVYRSGRTPTTMTAVIDRPSRT